MRTKTDSEDDIRENSTTMTDPETKTPKEAPNLLTLPLEIRQMILLQTHIPGLPLLSEKYRQAVRKHCETSSPFSPKFLRHWLCVLQRVSLRIVNASVEELREQFPFLDDEVVYVEKMWVQAVDRLVAKMDMEVKTLRRQKE